MKKFFLMLLMGISMVLSASPPSVDLPGPQFDGQQIQTFHFDVTTNVVAPEVAVIDVGDWLISEMLAVPENGPTVATEDLNVCLVTESIEIKFLPRPVLLKPSGSMRCCINNTDLNNRFRSDRQCSNYGYLSTVMQIFS
jgi:hypothetical protein